jgi:hypothetical protein
MDLMLIRRGLVGAGAALAEASALRSAVHDWQHKARPSSPISVLQDTTVGYGYRPLRAVWLLLGLLTAGTALFAAWPPSAVGDGKPPHFQPTVYTLDLLLPLVDLGQERSYAPMGILQWCAVALIGMGWLLATTVAAGASRVLRRA